MRSLRRHTCHLQMVREESQIPKGNQRHDLCGAKRGRDERHKGCPPPWRSNPPALSSSKEGAPLNGTMTFGGRDSPKTKTGWMPWPTKAARVPHESEQLSAVSAPSKTRPLTSPGFGENWGAKRRHPRLGALCSVTNDDHGRVQEKLCKSLTILQVSQQKMCLLVGGFMSRPTQRSSWNRRSENPSQRQARVT
ncbi:hypothetical protein BJX64DRAFT_78214 [Aspergillus heterothallicus]